MRHIRRAVFAAILLPALAGCSHWPAIGFVGPDFYAYKDGYVDKAVWGDGRVYEGLPCRSRAPYILAGPAGAAGPPGPPGPPGRPPAPGPRSDLHRAPLMWTAMESVQFEAGHAEIQSKCADKIAKVAAWMAVDRNVVIGLDGHRDDAVVNDNDPTLSARRVQAVRQALIAAGVEPNRIVAGAFEARPSICRGPAENCLALSRRVDVHAARF